MFISLTCEFSLNYSQILVLTAQFQVQNRERSES